MRIIPPIIRNGTMSCPGLTASIATPAKMTPVTKKGGNRRAYRVDGAHYVHSLHGFRPRQVISRYIRIDDDLQDGCRCPHEEGAEKEDEITPRHKVLPQSDSGITPTGRDE